MQRAQETSHIYIVSTSSLLSVQRNGQAPGAGLTGLPLHKDARGCGWPGTELLTLTGQRLQCGSLFRTQCCCSTLTYWAQSQELAAQREAEALAPWIFPSWTGERARKGYWERCKVRKQWMLGGGIKTHECTHRMVFKREEKLTKVLETQYSICRTDSSIERTLR